MKKILIVVVGTLIFAMIACGTVASMLTGTTAPVPTATAEPTVVKPTPRTWPTRMPTAVPDACPDEGLAIWKVGALEILSDAEPYMSARDLTTTGMEETMLDFSDRFLDLDGPECTWPISQEMANAYFEMSRTWKYMYAYDLDNAKYHSQRATSHFTAADQMIQLINAGN